MIPISSVSLAALAVAQEADVAGAATGSATAWGLGPPYYLGAATLTLILVIAHLLAPRLRRWMGRRSNIVGSFGGGMAAAYAFLHLIPELDEGHELLGLLIFFIPLVGFVFQYMLRRRFGSKKSSGAAGGNGPFVLLLLNLAVYNGLLVYGLPQSATETGWRLTPIVLAIVLHLVQSDYTFGCDFPRLYDSIGRYVLAAATLCGYALVVVAQQTNAAINDILFAFLAGSVLYNVFHEEIPDESQARIGWFISGIVLFTVCSALSASWA